jgi:Putative prokaryotic signal transducing protein
MKELLRTNDLVYLSFAEHILNEAGIGFMVLDEYVSAAEGSIGAFPRRVMVDDNSLEIARNLLSNDSLTITG